MRKPEQIAVVGVTGYSGFELSRILLRHPTVKSPVFYVRETQGKKCLAELFPQLRSVGEAPLRSLSVSEIIASNAGTAFLATPHEVSAEIAPALLEAGLRVVDLSGAFRFRSADTFASWYKLPTPHANWLSEAVYGLPELYAAEIATSRLIANPGCYATSVILALRPLAEAGLIADGSSVVCDCKSGASGAGKDPRRDLHFVEVDENFKAYNLFSHRHTPEILDHTGWSFTRRRRRRARPRPANRRARPAGPRNSRRPRRRPPFHRHAQTHGHREQLRGRPARHQPRNPRCCRDGFCRPFEQTPRLRHLRRGLAGHRHFRRRCLLLPRRAYGSQRSRRQPRLRRLSHRPE